MFYGFVVCLLSQDIVAEIHTTGSTYGANARRDERCLVGCLADNALLVRQLRSMPASRLPSPATLTVEYVTALAAAYLPPHMGVLRGVLPFIFFFVRLFGVVCLCLFFPPCRHSWLNPSRPPQPMRTSNAAISATELRARFETTVDAVIRRVTAPRSVTGVCC